MLFGSVSINAGVGPEGLIIQFGQEVGKSLVPELWGLLKTIQGSEKKIYLVFFSWFSESIWLFDIYCIIVIDLDIEESCIYVNLFSF